MERVICLVSGGIDSPLACALASKFFEVIPLHFCVYPYVDDETFFATIEVLKKLKSKLDIEKILIFPWSKTLRKISSTGGRYTCVLCRKGMLRAAEELCDREKCSAIVTGESIGQKASQTLRNLAATSFGIRFPILRPLLTMDKIEIEREAKRIGIWSEKHAGCCNVVPRHPSTSVKIGTVERLFAEIGLEKEIKDKLTEVVEIRNISDMEKFSTSVKEKNAT